MKNAANLFSEKRKIFIDIGRNLEQKAVSRFGPASARIFFRAAERGRGRFFDK
jgi:hypothetical protein